MFSKKILRKNIRFNLLIYCSCILIAFTGIFYGNAIKNQYAFLRIWEYQNILFLLLGIPLLFFQSKVNIPDFIETRISTHQRFLKPIIIGAVFGLLDIIIIKLLLHPEPYTELPPFLQPFPYSIFLFFSGAFEIEVFYRLIPLTLILILGKWISNGKYFTIFLWVALIVTSIREPLEQMPSGEIWFISYSLLSGFLMNFLQAIYFKNAGFLASLSVRLGHYLFWHILLGIYVQYFELVN